MIGEAQLRALLAIAGCAALGMIACGAIYLLLPLMDLIYQPVLTLATRGPIAAVVSGIGWVTLAVVCASFLIHEKMGHIGERLDRISSDMDAIKREAFIARHTSTTEVWPLEVDASTARASDAAAGIQQRTIPRDAAPTI